MRARGTEPARNLAARAGRWSARHRRLAIWGWIALVVAAIAVGGAVGTDTLDMDEGGVGESGRAERTVAGAFPAGAAEMVLVEARAGRVDRTALRGVAADVENRLAALPFVERLRGPGTAGGAERISADGRAALVEFEIPEGEGSDPEQAVEETIAAVAAAQRANPGFRIAEVGDASGEKAFGEAIGEDFQRAEMTSLPITLAILVVVFGALVAAGVPLLLALTAVAATIGLMGPISQISPISEQVNSVVLLIGLAVGVDYTMFYLRREREERAAGNSERASLEAAAATSGHAVLVSGFTVMVAMAGMYVAGDPTFASMATGTILVVAVAMVGSLTVLPALLAWLGDRVERGRVPLLGRLKGSSGPGAGGSRLWSAVVGRVLRRPLLSALASGCLLVALAVPALGIETANSGVSSLPRDLEVVRTYERVQRAFPGGAEPAQVVVSAADVGGDTAESKDFNDLLAQRMPWVFAFVLAAAFVLLLVSFRSIAIPLTAIGLNLLSVGAAYGVVVWIFQEGHLEGLLGFASTGAITAWLPLFLFVVLFGLSMDYHVFILSRIREAYDRGMPTEQAIAHGIGTTAGVVTSAAAVMVAVFAIFATLSFLDFKQMGVGLAAAILIDATIVRAVLLPATMKLLGERNWYLPRALAWLPRARPARHGPPAGRPRSSEAGA